MRRLFALVVLAAFVLLFACSNDSGDGADSGQAVSCDENNGACAPECLPYSLCTSEGSTCVIGGASCGHYWICHDTTWISDTSHDCDSGGTQPDASPDAVADGTVDAPADVSPADATDEPNGDDASDDGAAPDGDDAG